jgi:TolB-like protein
VFLRLDCESRLAPPSKQTNNPKLELAKAAQIESIAVLPFVNASGNADVEYLSDGMTESLINSLSQLPNLSVKARSSVFRYKGKEVDPQQVATELSVQTILNGRVVQRGDDLTLYLSLVDGRTGNQLWGEQYNRTLTALVTLQNEIAREVSQKLRARLSGADEQKLAKNYTQNAEAYQAYLKGLYYWHKGLVPGYEKSRDYFQQAIDLDPSYALAYSGLADYYGFAAANGVLPPNENWPKVEAAANRALTLDYTLAESYNPLAGVKLYYYRDWPAAERYFRRGIELNPNYAEIHFHYASCLSRFGRNEEALIETQRAIDLEPLSLRFSLNLPRILFFMRQYDRAIDQFQKTLELEPNFALAHEWLGNAYEQKGMHSEAIAEWGKALTLSGEEQQASILERAYASWGFEKAVRTLALKNLERLNEKTGRGEYVPAADYVMAYLRLGDKEKLFGWLAKAVEERNARLLDLRVNPVFDNLRSDPRFQDALRRLGL